MSTETLQFQAEVHRLLHIVVNSLYTHREIFLRELISNASDALDKLKFRTLTDEQRPVRVDDAYIRIQPDAEKGTLTLSDSGIGMSRDELVENLGTIAQSGTKRFLEAMEEGQSRPDLIGQFGVGFYAAFLVADRVDVISRGLSADGAWKWSSDAKESFTVEEAERETVGTDIVLHLKTDEREYLDEFKLRSLVRKYSDFVSHPILLWVKKTETDDEGKTVASDEREFVQINKASALWRRKPQEVTADEYDEFYRHVTHDWQKPLRHTHFKVEGLQSMTGLLYIPEKAPFEFMMQDLPGLRLFVKRVFVMEDCKEIVPEHLRFLRGVVDSEDLALNISRETLQHDKTSRAIRKQVAKKTLDLLEELANEEPEAAQGDGEGADDESKSEPKTPVYETFWKQFGSMFKFGVHADPDHRDRIVELLRFKSTEGDAWTSLADYVSRMKPDQEHIYFLTGEDEKTLRRSPHLEALLVRGLEVLLLTDPIDEELIHTVHEYQDKAFRSASHGDLDLESEDEKKEREESSKALEPLVERVKAILGERVQDVRLSSRLTDSPCCLVAPEGTPSAHLQRIYERLGHGNLGAKRIFELNPKHPLVANLGKAHESGSPEKRVEDLVFLLYDQARLSEGNAPEDPIAFSKRMTTLLTEASSN